MDADSYLDWSRISGLYLGNESHFARYRTYRPLLSSAGFTTIVVAEFLDDNRDEIEVDEWRTHAVYEPGNQCTQRVAWTAEALDAIGATRTAAAVRSATSHSPFDLLQNSALSDPQALLAAMREQGLPAMLDHLRTGAARLFPDILGSPNPAAPSAPSSSPPRATSATETRHQVTLLLADFVARHQTELTSDLQRHGDPRTVPGFTRKGRLTELELQARQATARDRERSDAELLDKLRRKLQKSVSQTSADPARRIRLEVDRRQFRDLLKMYRRQPADKLLPEMRSSLQAADTWAKQCPDWLAPPATNDPQLNARLAAVGEFAVDRDPSTNHVRWDEPRDLRLPWGTAHLTLTLTYLPDDTAALDRLLASVEQLRSSWPAVVAAWRTELVNQFRDHEFPWDPAEPTEDTGDDEGQFQEDAALAQVESADLCLWLAGGEVTGCVRFAVAWDDEHGCELDWDERWLAPTVEPTVASADQAHRATGFESGAVEVHDSGPPVTTDDLHAFAQRQGITLPESYRAFLLCHNGGRPVPGHLVQTSGEGSLVADVRSLFPLLPEMADAGHSTGIETLDAACRAARQQRVPPSLLPVGRVDVAGQPRSAQPNLWLALEGPHVGQLSLFDPTVIPGHQGFPGHFLAMPGLAELFLQMQHPLARDVQSLFRQLRTRPTENIPEWLEHLRRDDRPAFIEWLTGGGNLRTAYQAYGSPVALTALDYVTGEGSPELVRELLRRHLVKDRQIRDSWLRCFRTDTERFVTLMSLLNPQVWPAILQSPGVWKRQEVLVQLATAGFDFNTPVDDEGATAIHLAVQAGHQAAVKWLLEHGANPRQPDRFQRDAFLWAESGAGANCLPLLQPRTATAPTRAAAPDVPGIGLLAAAAQQLPSQTSLILSLEIKSPPETRVERAYGLPEYHYRLSIDLQRQQVTYRDMATPRQAYFGAGEWPQILFAPILHWPQLTPLWPSLEVQELDWSVATRKRQYKPRSRPDLLAAARAALEQALDPAEAVARNIALIR